tara:strand:- start:3077 stop:3370 length:294 start_codon:yes stop_codon:yes gene_type:complete
LRHTFYLSLEIDVEAIWVIQPAKKESIHHVGRNEPGINPLDDRHIKSKNVVTDNARRIREHFNTANNRFGFPLIVVDVSGFLIEIMDTETVDFREAI